MPKDLSMPMKKNSIPEKMWRNIVKRCRHDPAYVNVDVKMSKLDFINWANLTVRNFCYLNPGITPSIDRIDPDGHYELRNIRILGVVENRIRSRFIEKFLGIDKLHSQKDRLDMWILLTDHLCDRLGISLDKFLEYIKNAKAV